MRRLLLLYVAMYLQEFGYLQMMLFTVSSLLGLVYLAVAKPFVGKSDNRINIFNEFIVLMASYGITCEASFTDSSEQIGQYLVYIIVGSCSINFVIIMLRLLQEAYLKAKSAFTRKRNQMRKNKQEMLDSELF